MPKIVESACCGANAQVGYDEREQQIATCEACGKTCELVTPEQREIIKEAMEKEQQLTGLCHE